MPDTMPYEYKTLTQPHRYDSNETALLGHKMILTTRRRKGTSQWGEVKVRCKCKWKDIQWYPRKIMAMDQHTRHCNDMRVERPQLFEG